MKNSNHLLRITIAIILLTHAIPGMLDGGINDFGKLFLNQIGFSPYGVALAWAIKISHVICALLLILNKYIKPVSILTIFILLMGIVLVHFKEGWFVVGGGRNGIEYNFLLICVLVALMLQDGDKSKVV